MRPIGQFLSMLWGRWRKLGQFIGDMVGRAFLMLFYVTIALPFGLGVRLFSDPLDIRAKGLPAGWRERLPLDDSVEASHAQF